MEGHGGSEEGKEKKPWTTATMIENRGKWNLAADIEVLGYIKNFSHNLLSETQSTLKSLDSLEAELNSTSVGISSVANQFLSLADSQFVENRVYDDEETPGEEGNLNVSVLNSKTKEDDETDVFNKLKQSLFNGIEVLNTKFEAVHVPDIDSDEDEEEDDDDTAPNGIIYKPINPFNSRPLPHIIGSKEFMSDPTVGLQEQQSEDDEEEASLEEEESTSESKPAVSGNEDSEPESECINDNKIIPPAQNSSDDIFAVGAGQLSFAEHLAARLEGMKTDTKPSREATEDDSLTNSIATRSRQISVENSQDNRTDRYYDNGFDDRYDDYNDSIFGRNSRVEDEDDHEDLFVPKKNPMTSSFWDDNDEPYDSHPNPKKQLIQDLENALMKDTISSSSVATTVNQNNNRSMNNQSIISSSPANHQSANTIKTRDKKQRDELFGGRPEESDSLFEPKAEAPKKKMPAGAVKIFGGNVDLFGNNQPRINNEKENSIKEEQGLQRDPASKPKPQANFLQSEEEDDEDSLFSSAVHNREKKSSSSKNSSVKLSDSFQDDAFSVKSNKSAGLLDEEPPPPKTSTKAIDDLFKDINDDEEDDDLFSSYLTANKNNRSIKQTSASDDLFSSIKPLTDSNKRNITDDLFSDFKDDLFSSITKKSNLQGEPKEKKEPPLLRPSFGVGKKQNLFSDSDSDSEFLSTETTSNIFSKSKDPQKSTLSSGDKKPDSSSGDKTLFDGFGDNDDLFGISGNSGTVVSSQKSSSQKPAPTSKDDTDLFKVMKTNNTGLVEDVKINSVEDSSKNQKNTVTKSSRTPVSLFDQESDEDDELFGTKTVNNIKKSTDDDLLSDISKGKQISDDFLESRRPTFSSADYNRSEEIHKAKDNNDSLFNNTKLSNKSSSPPLYSEFNNIGAPISKNTKDDSTRSEFEPPPLSDDENIEADSNSDGIFDTNDFSITSNITRGTSEIFSNSFSETSSVERLDNKKESNISSSVYVSDNDESLFTTQNLSNTPVPHLEKKNSHDSIVSSKDSGKSLFEDAIDVSSSDIFSNIGKSGFKNKTENIFEKTATSVPSLLSSKDDDCDLFESGNKKTKVVQKGNLKTEDVQEKGPLKKLQHSSPDDLFNSKEPLGIIEELKKPELTNPLEIYQKANVSDKPQPAVKPSFPESPEKTEQSTPKVPVDIKPSKLIESSAKPQPPVKPSFPESSEKTEQSTHKVPFETKPSKPPEPLPESSSKPEQLNKPAKPIPPKSLNIRAPISVPDPFGQATVDSTDGGIFSSESKVKPPSKIPGKLNLEKTLTIDPKTLLPGAQPKFKKQTNSENTIPENSSSVTESSESAVSPTGVLRSINKDRAKIKAKRRPQTRKARREALRQSTADDDDETDNSSSNPTLSIVDQTTSSFEPSNILSPSTDEEDLFGVPPLDLPPDYTKVSTSPGDIFNAPTTVLSPDLSIKENIFDGGKQNESLEEKDISEHSILSKASESEGDILGSDLKDTKISDVKSSHSSNVKGDLFNDDFDAPKPSFIERVESLQKNGSEDVSVKKEISWTHDYDRGLFSSKASNLEISKKAEVESGTEENKPEVKNLMCGVLNASMNLCDKISAVSPTDDELFSSDWVSKKETKVVSVQEKKSNSLFEGGKTTVQRENMISDEIFQPKTIISSTSSVSKSINEQEKRKANLEPPLFENDGKTKIDQDDDDDDDLFKTTSTVVKKSNPGSSSKKVDKISTNLFSDVDEDDLFGNVGASPAAKSSDLLFASKQKTGSKFTSKPSAKSSLFADEDIDGDDGGDLFALPQTNKTSLPSKERQPKDSSKSSTNDSHNKFPSARKLSKDPHKPFVDPLSSLND